MKNKKIFIALLAIAQIVLFSTKVSADNRTALNPANLRQAGNLPLFWGSLFRLDEKGSIKNHKLKISRLASGNESQQRKNDWTYGKGLLWIFDPSSDLSPRAFGHTLGAGNNEYGTTLTFADAKAKNLVLETKADLIGFALDFKPQVRAVYTLNSDGAFRIEADFGYHSLDAKRTFGHDANGENQFLTLAHVFPLSAEVIFSDLTFNATYNIYRLTDFGKTAETRINGVSFFINYRINF
jgi:hypothetical protein